MGMKLYSEASVQAIADAIADEVKNRNKAISDESALRVAAEEELQRQINAIDFVDEGELATALAPSTKKSAPFINKTIPTTKSKIARGISYHIYTTSTFYINFFIP